MWLLLGSPLGLWAQAGGLLYALVVQSSHVELKILFFTFLLSCYTIYEGKIVTFSFTAEFHRLAWGLGYYRPSINIC